MTRSSSSPGPSALMMVGVLAANMSSLGASARLLLGPVHPQHLPAASSPKSSDATTSRRARRPSCVTLLGGVGVALFVGNLLDLFQYFISLPAIFGASIWLGFLWRRLTNRAVIVQIFVCFAIYAVIPNVFQ